MPDTERIAVADTVRSAVRELVLAAIVMTAIGGTTALLLLVGGFPIEGGLVALWSGSLGSWYAFTSATLVRAIPLLLTGSAVALAFRAGVLNIGAEGQLLIGAAAATAVALAMPAGVGVTMSITMALLAAAVGGAAGTGGVLVTKGKEVDYPVESKLAFTLDKDLTITR